MFLIETLLNLGKFNGFKRRIWFAGCFVVDPIGRRGDLALLWKDDVELEIHNFSQ